MVAQSRRPVRTLTFACSLFAMLVGTQSAPAATDGSEDTQFGGTEPCIVGYRFEPGPIVGGHYRQPTQAEFEARKRELLARSQGSGGRCSAPPLPSTAGASDAQIAGGSVYTGPLPSRPDVRRRGDAREQPCGLVRNAAEFSGARPRARPGQRVRRRPRSTDWRSVGTLICDRPGRDEPE